MDSDNIIDYLPRNPDEQLRIGFQILQKAYSHKAENLVIEVEQAKQFAKERQQDIVDLKTTIESLHQELHAKDGHIKELTEQNGSMSTEMKSMSTQIKMLSRELNKLNAFRKNIIKSINQDNLSEELSTLDIGNDDLSVTSPREGSAFSPLATQTFTSLSPSKRTLVTTPKSVPSYPRAAPPSSSSSKLQESPSAALADVDMAIEEEGKDFFKRAKQELR